MRLDHDHDDSNRTALMVTLIPIPMSLAPALALMSNTRLDGFYYYPRAPSGQVVKPLGGR